MPVLGRGHLIPFNVRTLWYQTAPCRLRQDGARMQAKLISAALLGLF